MFLQTRGRLAQRRDRIARLAATSDRAGEARSPPRDRVRERLPWNSRPIRLAA
jgi:hypothetical protein